MQNSKFLHIRTTSKTRAGGRQQSLQAYFIVYEKEGVYRISSYKSSNMLNVRNHLKQNFTLPQYEVSAALLKDFHFKFKGMDVIAKRSKNTGLVANNLVKPILHAAGIKDIVVKFLGANNPINMIAATEILLEKNREYIRTYETTKGKQQR